MCEDLSERKPVAKFPYSVIYSVRSDEIRILDIAHQKGFPFYWQSRFGILAAHKKCRKDLMRKKSALIINTSVH